MWTFFIKSLFYVEYYTKKWNLLWNIDIFYYLKWLIYQLLVTLLFVSFIIEEIVEIFIFQI